MKLKDKGVRRRVDMRVKHGDAQYTVSMTRKGITIRQLHKRRLVSVPFNELIEFACEGQLPLRL